LSASANPDAVDIYQVDKSATGEITKKKLFGVMVRALVLVLILIQSRSWRAEEG
jgi:hypothetical protein